MKRKSSSIKVFPIFLILLVVVIGLTFAASGHLSESINHVSDNYIASSMRPRNAVDIVQEHQIAILEAKNSKYKPLFWFLTFTALSGLFMGVAYLGTPFIKNMTGLVKGVKGRGGRPLAPPLRQKYINYAPYADDGDGDAGDDEPAQLPAGTAPVAAKTEWLE